MVRNNSHHKKGRSVLQKLHTRGLVHRPNRFHGAELGDCDTSSKTIDLESAHPQVTNSSNHVDKVHRQHNNKINDLKRLYKNTLQRERRAKLQIVQLRDATDAACEQLSSISKERDNAERALEGFKQRENASLNEVSMLHQHIDCLEQQIIEESKDIVRMSLELDKQSDIIARIKAQHKETYLVKEALRKKTARRDHNKEASAARMAAQVNQQSYSLKDRRGVIRPEVRDMLRQLACKGVGTEHASDIINMIAEGLGIKVVGSVSARSIARIMLEGLIQARMQVAYELDQANHFTICGDGTSIKNQQYEAKSIYIQPKTEVDLNKEPSANTLQPVLRTLGVQKAISHTAHHQLDGWIHAIDACCKALIDSPTGHNMRVGSKLVAPKLRGALTDHAADQKRFQELIQQWKKVADRESRAVPMLKKMTTEAQLSMLSKYLDDAANQLGDWRELPTEKQAALMHDAWLALALRIGENEFQKLSPESQFETDFFAWTGCCMHKELNAVKGGVAQMNYTWEAQGLSPPIVLRNKFQATNLLQSDTKDKATRGGVKLAGLAGALFNNKDDKKGYQYTVDDFFRKIFGYSNRFPDTSNTRYGSYCDAATELVLHTEAYIALLEALRDSKGTPGFTNIESNIYNGLQDTPTLTELAVLALYAQSIGRPYMRKVRSGSLNALELGPLHDRVKAHCRAVISNPSLLLSPATLPATGTLDGENWDRPEIVYRIAYLAPRLPDLQSLLIAFFKGALSTWERFSAEFEREGVIAQATPEQRHSAWVPPTNDVSEGALGQARQMLQRAPTMTDNQRNARVMWQKNNTYKWSQHTLTHADDAYIRHEARSLDANTDDQKIRKEINMALEERATLNRARKEKADLRKSATQEKLSKVDIIKDPSYESLSALRVKELDLQIDKLRIMGDSHIPAKSTIRTKDAKVKALLTAFESRKPLSKTAESVLIKSATIQPEEATPKVLLLGDTSSLEDEEMCFNDEVVF